jgi:hypothetical protein
MLNFYILLAHHAREPSPLSSSRYANILRLDHSRLAYLLAAFVDTLRESC